MAEPASTQKINAILPQETLDSTHTQTIHSGTIALPLRIIYDINSPVQSLLARHRQKIDVLVVENDLAAQGSAVPTHTYNHGQTFGRVPLKSCLAAVCISSPELLADDSRDYSVYYVDPLETTSSLNPVGCSNRDLLSTPISANSGVLVGVGLLSWWLLDPPEERLLKTPSDNDEEGFVLGRIINDRGTRTLEVIMSFKETPYRAHREYAESMLSLGVTMMTTSSRASVMPLVRARSSTPVLRSSPARSELSTLGSQEEPLCTSKTGRPPGASTHPEKRARRMAIMSHKESLEKMKNIAKMQRGEPHNRALVGTVDIGHPLITDEDIARQSKILEDLQARPLIIDRSPTLLTSKPLQRRKSTVLNITTKATQKQIPASPANAVASGSNALNNIPNSSSAPEKQGNNDLLTLLSTILSKVDSTSPVELNPQKDHGKGKEKEKEKEKEQPKIDNALATALVQLLPLLLTVQSTKGQTAATVVQTSSSSVAQTAGQCDPRQVSASQHAPHPPLRLFPTTDETFYAQQQSSHWPYDQHWIQSKQKIICQDPLKVSPPAHSVPGGGWARGKNPVSRSALPSRSSTSSRSKDQDATKCIIDLTQPEKENMPPTAFRGLKRSSSMLSDGKEKGNEKTREKTSGKKRRQEPSQPGDADANKSSNSRRAVMGSVEENVSRPEFRATSPARHTTTAISSEAMIATAISEPDFVRPRPIIASSSPDIIIEPLKTPPRRTESLKQDAGDSLFTPDPKSTPRADERSMTLCTPSPKWGKSHATHVASDMLKPANPHLPSGVGSDTQPVKTGWDLPPSSPPPPTSPVSPRADVGSAEDDAMPLQFIDHFANQPDGGRDNAGKDSLPGNIPIEICETNINAMDQEATTISLGSSAPIPAFDPLSEIDFNFELLDGEQGEMAVQNELDFDELWKTLGPVLVQAQNDTSAVSTNTSVEGQSFNFFEMSDGDGGQTAPDMQIDALKITNAAEELKALFSGCVV